MLGESSLPIFDTNSRIVSSRKMGNEERMYPAEILLKPVLDLLGSDEIKAANSSEQREFAGLKTRLLHFSKCPWSETLGGDLIRLANDFTYHPSFHSVAQSLLTAVANSKLPEASEAAQKLAVLGGHSGSVSDYLQNTVKKLSYASHLLPLAIGLGSAQLAAKGIRVGVYRVLGKSPWSFLSGEKALHFFSAASALTAQSAVFPAGLGLGQALLGRETHFSDYAATVKDGFVLMGGLNLAAMFSRSAFKVIHGVNNATGAAIRGVPWASLTQQGLAWGSELGALTLIGKAQAKGGDWVFHFIEGAGMCLQVRLGQGLHELAAPKLHQAYQRLDQAAYRLGNETLSRSTKKLFQKLSTLPNLPQRNLPSLAYAAGSGLNPSTGRADLKPPWHYNASSLTRDFTLTFRAPTVVVEQAPIGFRPKGFIGRPNGTTNDTAAIRRLLPRGKIQTEKLFEEGYVREVLRAFGVTDHTMDIKLFRKGVSLGKERRVRIAETAFDVDEVLLHWSLGLGDLFRGGFRRDWSRGFVHTRAGKFDYPSVRLSPTTKLSWPKRLWFDWLPKVLPMRMRQNIQFHPGMRALLLGLKIGAGQPLIMATTGPAGRILILANEDAAFKYIFFDQLPDKGVSMRQIREARNIYTRDDLLLALRRMVEKPQLRENPAIQDYAERVRTNPKKGVKIKHPAIAELRGKRPFSTLVDDSGATFRILGDLKDFTILQPPSARPSLTLNFTLGSSDAYLARMSNGYASELANLLGETRESQAIPFVETPADYPHQRFAIEIPWKRFGKDFVKPAVEMQNLARSLSN